MKEQSKTGLGLMMVAIAAVAFGGSFAAFSPDITIQNDSSEGAVLKGHVDLVQRNELGEIIGYRQSDNSITNNGMQLLSERLISVTNSSGSTLDQPLTHIGIGTNGEAGIDSTNADLNTVVAACDRVAIAAYNDLDTDTSADLQITVTATIDAGADAGCAVSSIDEAGIFNNATNGNMFAINNFTSVTLAGTDTLDITWTFDFSDT